MGNDEQQPICLTVAGLDPSGGAGIIADIKTFSAFGCYSAAVVTSLTFQNTQGVYGSASQTAETVRKQIEPILEDLEVAAIKTGMLPTREIIEEVARLIRKNDLRNIVVDPVVRSTSGFDLIDENALRSLTEKLFPVADLITPNLFEAERISRIKIENKNDIEKAAKIMQGFGAKNVLIKGGHLPIAECGMRNADLINYDNASVIPKNKAARDFLFAGNESYVFEAEFIETTSTHGTGCTIASAIAANLALGKTLIEAVEISKKFVTEAIRTAPEIGRGNGPVNHFAKIE